MLPASLYEDDGNQMRCRNAGRYSSLHSFRQHRWTIPLSNLGSTESVLDPPDSEVGKAGPFPWKSSWHSRGDGELSKTAGYTRVHSRGRDQLCPLRWGLEKNFVGAGKDCTIQRIRRKCSNRRTRMNKEQRHKPTGQEKRAVVSWDWSYVAGGARLRHAIYTTLFSVIQRWFSPGKKHSCFCLRAVACGSKMKNGPKIDQLELRGLSACWSHIPG